MESYLGNVATTCLLLYPISYKNSTNKHLISAEQYKRIIPLQRCQLSQLLNSCHQDEKQQH